MWQTKVWEGLGLGLGLGLVTGENDGLVWWLGGGLYVLRRSNILPSCNFTKAVVWGSEMGCRAWTSQWISGERPKMKQLRGNEGGSPIMWLARRSNSVK